MKSFNLYEIADLFDTMRCLAIDRDTIGLLNKQTGHCHYIGYVENLPKLLEMKFNPEDVIFIQNNGHAQGDNLWTQESFDKEFVEMVLKKYIPQLLPIFQSREYPFCSDDYQEFDYDVWSFADDNKELEFLSRSGFFAFIGVYAWCQEQKLPLLPPAMSYKQFADRWRKEQAEEEKRRDEIQPFYFRTTDKEILFVDKETGETIHRRPRNPGNL